MIQAKRFSHAAFETPDLERQIDYFTQVVGLAVAARENGRAHLATTDRAEANHRRQQDRRRAPECAAR